MSIGDKLTHRFKAQREIFKALLGVDLSGTAGNPLARRACGAREPRASLPVDV